MSNFSDSSESDSGEYTRSEIKRALKVKLEASTRSQEYKDACETLRKFKMMKAKKLRRKEKEMFGSELSDSGSESDGQPSRDERSPSSEKEAKRRHRSSSVQEVKKQRSRSEKSVQKKDTGLKRKRGAETKQKRKRGSEEVYSDTPASKSSTRKRRASSSDVETKPKKKSPAKPKGGKSEPQATSSGKGSSTSSKPSSSGKAGGETEPSPIGKGAEPQPSTSSGKTCGTVESKPVRNFAPPGENSENDEILTFMRLCETSIFPRKATNGSCGYDLFSATKGEIQPGESGLIETGIRVKLPKGTYGRVAPRSGLAFGYMIGVGGGVIDRDYEGQIKVLLFNHSKIPFEYLTGHRIAQLIIEKIAEPKGIIYLHQNLSPASVTPVLEASRKRGEGGFGSTGLK